MYRLKNTGYYLSEVGSILKRSGVSAFLSLLSLSLMCFVLMLVMGGWFTASSWVDDLNKSAEISVYYDESLNVYSAETLVESVEALPGITSVTPVSKEEADRAMREVLGDSADILTYFDETPFEAYLEVHVDLTARVEAVKLIEALPNVAYVRDNADLLEQLERLNQVIQLLGIVIGTAVLLTSFMITTHITREGIEANRQEIETLFLLGAPRPFVFRPYLWNGILLSTAGGILGAIFYMLTASKLSAALLEVMPFAASAPGSHQHVELLVIGFAALTGLLASLWTLNRIGKRV